MKNSTTKQLLKKAGIILFWLVVWEGCAFFVDNNIVLVGPIEVVKALFGNLFKTEFIGSVAGSLLRISMGFSAAFLAGMLFGAISVKFAIFKDFAAPLVSVSKSVPVASFVVLLLLIVGAKNLSFYICFLIVFPNIYISTIQGLESADKRMLEMADAFEFGLIKKIRYIYRDSLYPFIRSSLKVSLGMAWKSGVAAEVIGLPQNSIGERIYTSKIYLDTADLFAWTIIVILLSFLTEKIVIKLVDLVSQIKLRPAIKKTFKGFSDNNISIKDISVSFEERSVIDSMDVYFAKGKKYCVMGPSGAGKTTLLKEIIKRSKVTKAVMFQEDRLIENADAVTNIWLGNNFYDKKELVDMAEKLLPADRLYDKVASYSGGMKRRTALLRTLARKADLVLLDEPFTGLDDDTKNKAIDLIKETCAESTVVCVTHDEEDAKKLGGKIIWMKELH